MAHEVATSDMIFEVLSRTTLKSLDASRCVCKEWNHLTYGSSFLDLHTQRNSTVSGYLVQNIRHCVFVNKFAPLPGSSKLDLDFLPQNARIVASSEQGMLVFESPHPKHHRNPVYHVCKPSIRQIVQLPNPKTRFLTEKVALVVVGSNPLRYKIIRLSWPKHRVLLKKDQIYNTYRCEIFDSATWAWRELGLILLPFCVFPTNSQPITVRGSVYFLLTNNEVLKFDVESETWTSFTLPTPTLDYDPFDTPKELVKYEGKLGFSCRPPNGCWELWVTESNQMWERKLSFGEDDDVRKTRIKAFCDSDTSVMQDYDELIFYKFKKRNNNVKKVKLDDRPYEMFALRSDLEADDLKGR